MHTQNLIGNAFTPYSFQEQEHDDEMKGEGNSYTTFYRQHDNSIDGSKGSIVAQGSLTFNDWLHSPAFSPLQTVIYDNSKNILNVPSSSKMRTNSNSDSNSIKLK